VVRAAARRAAPARRETLPYDGFSPHHDLVSERLATLYRIMRED